MFPFFNKKEIKIEDKKSGNNIYITQESFKTENENFKIEGISTSIFMNLSNNDFLNSILNPFNFMLPFSSFLSNNTNKAIENKSKQ
ncbi:MAG TPA: hypothetical protein PKW55_05760 [Spirochaetota bacterium]|nr:hypothetical protein [Spirochaetota bacterium]HOM37542.1 hypothetical protein [Spirochaetota bacterium]HPQ49486.1 hypothetical protein [Spirochaetota bacterium]